MADIRIKDLPLATGITAPVASDVVAIDGTTTRRATIADVGNIGVPIATQSEAESGVNAEKRMTPLTTKQSIASEVGVTVASQANGLLASTAVQPSRQIISGSGLTGGGDLSSNVTLNVGAGTGLSVSADSVGLDTTTQSRLLPSGGASGQALVKSTNANYDVAWSTPADMFKSTYDPTNKNADAFNRANHYGANIPDNESVTNAKVFTPLSDSAGVLDTKLTHTQAETGGVSRSVFKVLNEWLTPQRFGAEGNDSTECGPAFIAAKNALLEHGGTLTIPAGRYRTSINLDFTTDYSSYAPDGRISIDGAGANVCQIVYTGVNSPTSFLLDMGDDGTGEGFNVRSYMRISGLGLTSLNPNYIGGLCLRRQAYFDIDNFHSFGLSEGLRLESSLSGQVSNSWLQGNRTGAYLLKGSRSGAFSSPNAVLFANVVVGENSENGVFADNPGPLTILGGTFEGNLNALTVLRDATMAGLGPVALNILGATYFEHNSGEADIKISQLGSVFGGIGQYNIIANFNRISSSVKTTNNIKIVHNSGVLQANIQSSFVEAGTYTASGSELYIAVSGSASSASRRVLDTGSTYQSAVAKPTLEAMQDYEGGTFTPVITGVTTSGATGWFEKRGRFVSGEMSFNCTGSAAGALSATIPGAPVPDIFSTASGMEVNTTAKAVVGFINASTSSVQGIRFADGTTGFVNGHVVRVSFRYRSSS